jgi:hypothetical protein
LFARIEVIMYWRGNEGAKPRVVSQDGAPQESILYGVGHNNHGLRLRVLQQQPKGDEGPICGSIVVLDVGDNRHADALVPFLGRVTTALEVLAALRVQSPACVHVVNASALAVEKPVESS